MCEPSTTVNNKCHDDTPVFRIEDNILIGQEIPLCEKPVNVAEAALEILKSKPDFIGQVDALTDKVNTYADMSERSIKCALWLRKQGVKPGDIIGLCTDNNLDAMLILMGIMYTGAVCNTWDHDLSPITARYFLALTSPKIIFAIASSAASLREVAKELKMDVRIVTIDKLDGYEFFEDILKGHGTREVVEFKCTAITNPKDVCLIVPSSGTTGMPKGTKISHYSINTCLHPMNIEHMRDNICLFTPTLRWHYGVLLAYKAIMACSTRIVVPDCDDDVAMCEFIEKYRVTWLGTDPFMLIKFVKNGLLEKYRLPTLKEIISSGAHFRKEFHEALVAKLPHTKISNTYGMTDAASVCSSQSSNSKYGSIGFVANSVRIRIVDVDTEETLGSNEIGEIRIKLPSVMNGYHNNPEATKQAFDFNGWLRSGDLGYYDEDGEMYIVDRMSHFINFRAINVSPAEIETVLGTHPAVFQAAVIGIPDEVDEQRPMAIVCRTAGKTVTEDELTDLIEKNMPDHCRLRGGVKFVEEFPRTATGKIAKRQLQQMFVE